MLYPYRFAKIKVKCVKQSMWLDNKLICDQAFFFPWERGSVAARESAVGRREEKHVVFPSLLPTADSRTTTLSRFPEKKKRTPDRRLIASAQDMFGREPCSLMIGLAVTGEIF